jgi:uncharacterized repeat protein (TIGR04138 family)
MSRKSTPSIDTIVARDGRYPLEAYHFLQAGLEHTAVRVHGDRPEPAGKGEPKRRRPGPRHITAVQLCDGLRDFAIQLWGPMALDVLAEWKITSTRDFGAMVYLLVDNGMLATHEDDAIADFDNVYDFKAAFGDYRVSSAIVPDESEADC